MTDSALDQIVVGLGNPGPEYDWTRHNLGFHVVDRIAEERGQLFHSASKLSEYTLSYSTDGKPVGSFSRSGSGYRFPAFKGSKSFVWAHIPEFNAWLIKPMTFMNRSGQVVGPLANTLLSLPPELSRPSEPDSALENKRDELEGAGAGSEAPTPRLDLSRLLVVYDDLDLDLGRLRLRPHGGHGGHNGMRSIFEHLGSKGFPRLRVGIGSPGTDAVRHVLETFPPAQRVEAEISVAESAEAILDWLEHRDFEGCMTRFHSRWNRES